MTNSKWFASIVLALTLIPSLQAETHCPGNVPSVHLRKVNQYQMIIPVSMNHSGPFNFLLDTGSQITMVDPSLAEDLRSGAGTAAHVEGVGFRGNSFFAQVDMLEVGAHVLANQKVLVYDLRQFNSSNATLRIQGILGEDFLEHFDMLVDNSHNFLCLDESTGLRASMKGAHIMLLRSVPTSDGEQVPESIIFSARLSDGMRPVRLKLDSGSNVPFLYNTSEYMALGLFRGATLHGGGADGAQRTFTALPAQNTTIGSIQIPNVRFVTLAGSHKDSRNIDFDGLLTMGLFRRVFIGNAGSFAVLDPW
jgi:hypothetical protein